MAVARLVAAVAAAAAAEPAVRLDIACLDHLGVRFEFALVLDGIAAGVDLVGLPIRVHLDQP